MQGKFENEVIDDMDYDEYLGLLNAERKIAQRMIKQKLDNIDPKDYKESTD
jgi:hypothetical protein